MIMTPRYLAPMVGAVLALAATEATAAFTAPTWSRPADAIQAADELTTYQRWTPGADTASSYASQTGPNAPDEAVNPNGTANVFDAAFPASGSFVISSGRLYSPAGVIEPRVTVPGYDLGPAFQTEVLVQLFSFGDEIDTTAADALLVNGLDATALDSFSYTELSRNAQTIFVPDGQGGVQEAEVFGIEHAWSFTAPGSSDTLQLDFSWGASSTSLGELIVDTQTIPEPASLTLLGLGAAALRRRRRR